MLNSRLIIDCRLAVFFGAALPLRGKPRPWSAIPPPPPLLLLLLHLQSNTFSLHPTSYTRLHIHTTKLLLLITLEVQFLLLLLLLLLLFLLLLSFILILEPIKFDFRANSNLEPTTILEPISNLDKSSILEPISNLEPSTILEPNSILEPIYNKFSLSRALGWKLLSVLLVSSNTSTFRVASRGYFSEAMVQTYSAP